MSTKGWKDSLLESYTITAISYELFPTQTKAGEEQLHSQVPLLAESRPDHFSITFAAEGSTRQRSLNTL